MTGGNVAARGTVVPGMLRKILDTILGIDFSLIAIGLLALVGLWLFYLAAMAPAPGRNPLTILRERDAGPSVVICACQGGGCCEIHAPRRWTVP